MLRGGNATRAHTRFPEIECLVSFVVSAPAVVLHPSSPCWRMSARLAPSSRPLPLLFVAFLSLFVFPWLSLLWVINVIIIIRPESAGKTGAFLQAGVTGSVPLVGPGGGGYTSAKARKNAIKKLKRKLP